jgi:COP9 signalosome complex subunit 5
MSSSAFNSERKRQASGEAVNPKKSQSSTDAPYAINAAKLAELSRTKPFLSDPKYFKNARISPSAAMKMMQHVQTGVEKGVKTSLTGKPTEVMGYLIGRQCTDDPTTLIISDAQALPIEGFETSVVADTEEITNYQINWLELNGKSRHPCEKFCGWYHSHPFDVEDYSHCFLSATDVTTQLAWQRSCEKDGDPWLAIVVDPLRSLARGVLELQSFRVYPPEFTAPLNETPDGKIVTDDKQRMTLWGSCWNRYYRLNTTYFMSQLSSDVLGILKNNFLWQNALSSTSMLEPEQRQSTTDRLLKLTADLSSVELNGSRLYSSGAVISSSATALFRDKKSGMMTKGSSNNAGPGLIVGADFESKSAMTRAAMTGCAIGVELCQHCCSQMSKLALFGNPNLRKRAQNLSAEAAQTEMAM